jgi:hypothetical protein
MDRNNYIEIHPTQAQVAKISYHNPSKYLNQIVSPQLQYVNAPEANNTPQIMFLLHMQIRRYFNKICKMQ